MIEGKHYFYKNAHGNTIELVMKKEYYNVYEDVRFKVTASIYRDGPTYKEYVATGKHKDINKAIQLAIRNCNKKTKGEEGLKILRKQIGLLGKASH